MTSSTGSSTGEPDTPGSSEGSGRDATSSTGSESSSEGDSSGDTGDDCAFGDGPAVMWAENAMLVAPMELQPAPLLPGTPMVARSYSGQAGTITFAFELPCAKSVEVHGLVWDAMSGIQADDPDSYFVSMDAGPESVWTYGCGSGRLRDGTWLWERVQSVGQVCEPEALVYDLDAGPHEFVLRNRESGGGTVYAAIAAVVVTSDPELDPTSLYDPAG